MTRRGGAAALLVVLAGFLTACGSEADDPGQPNEPGNGAFAVDVDVNTPQLRRIKKDAGVEPCRPGDAAAPADGMPDLVLSCLGGGPDVNLSSLTGPLVVNLWAQWCGPCREELPYYQQLHQAAGGKVQVIGIDYQDTQPGAALELLRDTGVTFPQLADPAGEVRVPFEVRRGLPGVVFVDREGVITHIEYVVIGSYDELRDMLEEHLDITL